MVKKIQSKKYSFLYILFGILFLLSLQTQNIYSQYSISRTTNEKGVPGAMQRGAGTINPYNGSLIFSLPLASVGNARGEVGYEVPLVIKNQWSVRFAGSSWTCTNQPNCVPNLSNSIKFNYENGILPGLGEHSESLTTTFFSFYFGDVAARNPAPSFSGFTTEAGTSAAESVITNPVPDREMKKKVEIRLFFCRK